ncbi:MAG: serine/threonine protein kinase [Phycisphaerales bacterium]|nr:serine/threonine protein kinase [Phycisphaerales bacterium]
MSSSDVTWHDQLGSAFLKARELDDASRSKFLEDLKSTDAEMASWVQRMIDAEQKSSPVLEGSSPTSLLQLALPDIVGTRVGQYMIRSRIGAGGMGAVYEAMQDKPNRVVAVKVLPAGLGSPAAARRFEYESEVLARLRHPAIAQVYESGIHQDGGLSFPYFAMEFVPEAKSITAYASSQRLNTRRIVELFIEVCDAIHHGHQRGVIHRDLKPENILVDAGGRPKVIDFGVARAVDQDVQALTMQTQAGELVGTAPYMSPEQVGGKSDDLDTRTDVYSLGVVLFELLTGQLPHDLRGKTLLEAIQTIRETRPAKAATINPAIPLDLDTILAKALAQDRERRYSSAADLGADLVRYLRNEPIAARPPTMAYQLKMFAKRNKTAVAAAVIVLIVLVGGIVAERVRANQAITAREQAVAEREKAETEAARANRVVKFLNDMLAKVTPDEAMGESVTVQEVLDAVAADIDNELSDAPEVEATIRFVIGQTYRAQGLDPQAKAMLTKASQLHKSLGIRTLETAQILKSLGGTLVDLSEFDAALAAFDASLAIAEDEQGPNGDIALGVHTERGEVLYARGRFEEVADTLRRVIEIRVARDGEDDAEVQMNRANLAMVLQQLGEYEQAMTLMQGALDWYTKNNGEADSITLALREALANIAFTGGDHEESNRISREIIEAYRKHFGNEHAALANALYQLGARLTISSQYAEAEDRLREALAIREKTLGPENIEIAQVLSRLASAVANQGRVTEALDMEARALRVFESLGETESVPFAWALHEHASTLLKSGDCDAAKEVEQRAAELLERFFGTDSDRAMPSRHALALIEVLCGDTDKGVFLSEKLLADRRRILAPDHPDIPITLLLLGRAYMSAGKLEDAAKTYGEAIELYAALGDSYDNERMYAMADRSICLQVLGRSNEGLPLAKEAHTWFATHDAPEGRKNLARAALAGALLDQSDTHGAGIVLDSGAVAPEAASLDREVKKAEAFLCTAKARWLVNIDKPEESQANFSRAEKLLSDLWGDSHPITLWSKAFSHQPDTPNNE